MIIVLVGESASGKSTIEKMVMEHNRDFTKIVSYTTRPKRNGEVDDVDYHFIDEKRFMEMRDNGLFIESAQYRGWNYGSAKKDYDDGNHIVVLTPHGCRSLKRLVKDNPNIKVVSIYFDVDRRSRMIRILKRGDDIDEAYRRNISDVGQFDGFADEADYIIENHKYAKSIKKIYDEVIAIINEVRDSK